MVSFTCGRCQDVVKKPKVLSHAAFCHCDHFTCVDCMNVFTTNTVKDHTTCVTETEKYQGKWKQRRQETHQQKSQSQIKALENNNCNNKQANKHSRSAQLNHFLNNDDDDDDDGDDSWITQKKTSKNCEISDVLKSTNNPVRSKITKKEEEEEEKCTSKTSTHQLEKISVKDEKTSNKQQNQQSKKDESLSNTETEYLLENVDGSAIRHKHSRDNVMQSADKNVPENEICLQTITLGTAKEIWEQLEQLYNENGVSEMTGKEIATQLTDIYKSRIIHAIKQSLPLLKENGVMICTNSKSDSNKIDEVDGNKLRKSHKRWRLVINK